MTDHIGGQVPAGFGVMAGALPHVRSGKLIALAVSGRQRSAQLPALPTVAESGYPGFEVEVGYFVMVPAKTPKPWSGRSRARCGVRSPSRRSGAHPRARHGPGGGDVRGRRRPWIAVEHDKRAKVIREKGIRAE